MKISRNRASLISFKNVGRDFSSDYILMGKTKSGRYRVGEIGSEGPEGYTIAKNRITTIEKQGKRTRHWLKDSGSALNAMYRDE
jgi:hypothetical protein